MRKRKLELTPMKVKRGLPPRWRKVHKGVIYYYRGEYQEALRQWHQKLVELEAKEGEPPEKVVERLEATLAQMDNLGIELTDQSHISIDQNGLSHCVRGRLVYEQEVCQIDFPFPQRLARAGP